MKLPLPFSYPTHCHSERRRSSGCGRSSQSRNLLFRFILRHGFCVFAGVIFPSLIFAQDLPPGWRRPTKAEISDNWRMKNSARFVTVKGDFDGDGKADIAKLLVGRSPQQCALFVWLSRSRNNSPELLWKTDKGGLIDIGIRLVHPGKYETICSSDSSQCEPQTPTNLNLKTNGIEFFSHGATRSFLLWDRTTKKFRWVPIGD